MKIKLVGLEAQSSSEIERVVATFAGEPHGGLIIAPNVVNFANSDLIVTLATRHRLPAIYPFAFYAKQGGLISYGFDAADQFRQGAVYADKILRGANPPICPCNIRRSSRSSSTSKLPRRSASTCLCNFSKLPMT